MSGILLDIAEWPYGLYKSVTAGSYGGLAGLAVAYYLLGNPLTGDQSLMQLAQSYALYGAAVVAGDMVTAKK